MALLTTSDTSVQLAIRPLANLSGFTAEVAGIITEGYSTIRRAKGTGVAPVGTEVENNVLLSMLRRYVADRLAAEQAIKTMSPILRAPNVYLTKDERADLERDREDTDKPTANSWAPASWGPFRYEGD